MFSGGEPLLVNGIMKIAEHLHRAKVDLILFTSGWEEMDIAEAANLFTSIHISLDGSDESINDMIRGKKGSFVKALNTLRTLNAFAQAQQLKGQLPLRFGIDCVVIETNFHQMENYCKELAWMFPAMSFINFGAAVPSGLANRESFAELELLTEDHLNLIRDVNFCDHLKRMAPPEMDIRFSDNFYLQYHPDHFIKGIARDNIIQLEPDGSVRGMLIYEGTVGNITQEPIELIWPRVIERRLHPFVVETLKPVKTMRQWSVAARQIDSFFSSEANLARIKKRKPYLADTLSHTS